MAALEPGNTAENFALPELGNSEERTLPQSNLTLLAFFKVTCPTCKLAMPYVNRFAQYQADGLEILGVAQDPPEDAKAFTDEFGVTIPVALDMRPYPISNAYGITNVPTVFLVEPGRQIAETVVGFDKDGYNRIAERIGQHLSTKPIEIVRKDDNVPAFKPG